MSKNRYRVNICFSYEFETDKETKDAQLEAEEYFNALTSSIILTRKQIKLDKIKQTRHQICLGEFKINEVLPFVSRDDKKKDYEINGVVYQVRMDSPRYFVFKENATCSACGLEGVKFCLEQSLSDKSPHFNLYGVENGRHILMTKDHIHPKSVGGVDMHSNFQTMCTICNNLKGSDNISLEKIKELRILYDTNKNLPKKRLNKVLDDARAKFTLPHGKPHVPKKNRKAYLSKLQYKDNAVVTNIDLRIWKLNVGGLIARSLYEEELPEAFELASIRIGTVFNIVDKVDNKVVIKLDNGENCEVYQGYFEYLKASEEEFLKANEG